MKQKVLGGKKVKQEPSAVRDPLTGDLMVSSSDIKRTTLQYCIDNLKNNKASKNVEVTQKLKEFMHKLRMLEDNHDEFEIEKDEFDDVLKHFAKKDTKSYDFLLKTGESYKEAIFMLCRMMLSKT